MTILLGRTLGTGDGDGSCALTRGCATTYHGQHANAHVCEGRSRPGGLLLE